MSHIVRILAVLIGCLAISSSTPGVTKDVGVKKIDVKVLKNRLISPLLQTPRGLFVLKPVLKPLARALDERQDGQDGNGAVNQDFITYTVGSRLDGDRLVAKGGNSEQFATLEDVQAFLQYPGPNAAPGSGAIITYVEIAVNQNSNLGNAYIIDGGIGQRNIQIVLEMGSVSSYSFIANIYGF